MRWELTRHDLLIIPTWHLLVFLLRARLWLLLLVSRPQNQCPSVPSRRSDGERERARNTKVHFVRFFRTPLPVPPGPTQAQFAMRSLAPCVHLSFGCQGCKVVIAKRDLYHAFILEGGQRIWAEGRDSRE